ncbi:MAG: hypothetical protein RL757_628 [Bacteroidota bacterium]
MIQNLKILLAKAVHFFYKHQFDKIQIIIESINVELLDKKQASEFVKFQKLFSLGQLLGLTTLHAILEIHGIKSNNIQKKYSFLCKTLTHNKLHKIQEYLFAEQLKSKLEELASQSESEWSKSNVTVVGDASVFKQNLNKEQHDNDYYSSWFSGQYHTTVTGFKILTLGVVISGIFYPLYYEFIGKKNDKEKELFCKLLKKFKFFWEEIQKKHAILPKKLHLSCDNGYSCKEIVESCDSNNLILLSVPKKNNLFKINNISKPLNQWIETEYLEKEKAFLSKQNTENKEKINLKFTLRIKAYYKALGIEVLLLFFRYNHSEKVTVIYCPVIQSPNIFAKTMRHHWFSRTQIEQFFRTVKHILKIQEVKSQTKIEMDIKLGRFLGLALDAQLFTKYLKKTCKVLKNAGFKQIIKHIIFNLNKLEELENLLVNEFN